MLIRLCHYQRRLQVGNRVGGVLFQNSIWVFCTELHFKLVENYDLLGSMKPAYVITLVQAE